MDSPQLLHVFFEAAYRASILPFASEATIYAMKSFGAADMKPAIALAVFGAMIGHAFNYFVGRSLQRLPSRPQPPKYLSWLASQYNRWGFVLLFFAYAPLCNLLVLLAGMAQIKPIKVFPIILAGLIFYYGQLVF